MAARYNVLQAFYFFIDLFLFKPVSKLTPYPFAYYDKSEEKKEFHILILLCLLTCLAYFSAKNLYDILEDPNTHNNFGTMTDMLNVVPLIYELVLSTLYVADLHYSDYTCSKLYQHIGG